MKRLNQYLSTFFALLWTISDLMGTATSVSPEFVANCVPVVLVNATGQPDTELYFVAHALDPCGLPCYLVPDPTNGGICTYVYPNVSGSPSSAANPAVSLKFSELNPAINLNPANPLPVGATAYVIYIPICSSARGYISVGQPMYLPTIFNPAPSRMVLDIGDSSVTALNDVNYYTLYQDFEFGLVNYDPSINTTSTVATTLYINLSWVDYFCLPMHLAAYSYTSSGTNPLNLGQPYSGTKPGLTRENIISSMNSVFSSLTSSYAKAAWLGLGIPFYTNPYKNYSGNKIGTTRILAAKNSIALKGTTQFVNLVPNPNPPNYFPPDYCSNTANGPIERQSYMIAMYNYLVDHPFTFTITPPENTTSNIYTLSGESTTQGLLNFTGVAGNSLPAPPTTTLQLYVGSAPPPINTGNTQLTTEQLLSGSVWPFTGGIATGYTNELSKAVSALFSIGQLPVVAPFTAPFVVTQSSSYNADPRTIGGFGSLQSVAPNSNSYFQASTGIPTGWQKGPWNNLYVSALHQNLDGAGTASATMPFAVVNNKNLGLGYAYDYDDLLGQAGLMAIPIQDGFGNSYTNASDPTQDSPYVLIIMESLQNTPISAMNINNDAYDYTVSLTPANNGVSVTFSYWYYLADGVTLEQTTITPPLTGNSPYFNVHVDPSKSQLFQVEFNYDGETYLFNVNLLRQLVTPSSPSNPFSTPAQQLLEGVTFTIPITEITAQFPLPLQPWFKVLPGPNFGINVASSPPGWPG